MVAERLHSQIAQTPRHIALIMDGNGRWACWRGLSRTAGHQAATRHLLELIHVCNEFDIPYLTLYTFSTENWRRPRQEVEGMFRVISDFLDTEIGNLHRLGVRLRHLGRIDEIEESLQARARRALELTRANTGLCLTVAFNYGGRADIIDAVRALMASGVAPDMIDEQMVHTYLSTHGLPDPDLVIRTSGEQRLSNFLLWETAYSVFWTTPTFWPDFRSEHLRQAIEDYQECQHDHYQVVG
jgi:undecaprenyl diphosphate synthase